MQKGLDFLCVQKLFRKRDIKVNGRRLSQSVMLEVGDKVECFVEEHSKRGSIERIFEDDNLACHLSNNEEIVANRRHDKVIVPQNYIDSYKIIIGKV